MTATVNSFLSSMRLGDPTHYKNLSLVPIFHESNAAPDYITLEDGLADSLIEIEELDSGASVNNISFTNLSDQYALLFEGEEFLGAMQNRILNVSVFASPKSKQKLPVSCVEAGRWEHRHQDRESRRFKVADRMHYARGRAKENRAVSMNMAASNEYRGNQSEVWEDIELKSMRLKAASDTGASQAIYESQDEKVSKFVKKFKHEPKQVGSIFVVNGSAAGLEVFASSKTHKRMLPRLVRSYAVDALDEGLNEDMEFRPRLRRPRAEGESAPRSADEFVAQLRSAWTKEFDGLCLGRNVRFKDDTLSGGALVHEDRVLHLCAFSIAA